MELTPDRFVGCVLGLATGDALGAPYEGGPVERLLWRLIGRTSDGCLRWTDDTQMAIDLAESLMSEGEVCPSALARQFASSYRWSRGYGPGAAKVLRRIRRGEPWEQASQRSYPGGSYGNGAAMRAPVVALFFHHDREQVIAAARLSAQVTHAHPLGIEGAVLIATAAHALLQRGSVEDTVTYVRKACVLPEMTTRLEKIDNWLHSGQQPTARDVARTLGNGTAALKSCPTALYVALRHIRQPFEDMMRFVIACRGDVDTLAAMAGALWGIANGPARLPPVRLEARDRLVSIAEQLFQARGK
jgi:poly(ADP-ribose) glycohydrolase ARH3